MSGVGKGIATSSIGKILQAEGFTVNPVKIDPYLNVDAGNMNPTEHGEVFVLKSGLETDQDMGNYERFMDAELRREDYITSGMVYRHVIEKERNLGYHGKCVEAIPHITGEITRRIEAAADMSGSAISLVEIGGTVGDYQNTLFIEAARVLRLKNPHDVIFILVSYLPLPSTIGEMKTRPTQNAVRQLNSYGVQPDIIIARSRLPLDQKRKEKIAISCSVYTENVISAPDIDSVYDVPINFERDGIADILLKSLHLRKKPTKPGMAEWKSFVSQVKGANNAVQDGTKKPLKIAVVGKYFDSGDFVFSDAYVSVIEAIKFSSYHVGVKPDLHWINSKDFETRVDGKGVTTKATKDIGMLADFDGILVPGGFGQSGIEGILMAIRFARENHIPYFGLCYGMQLLCIEYARNVLGLKGATTAEIDANAEHKIIDIMPDQKKKIAEGNYGGSMRLGSYPCVLGKGTIAEKAYNAAAIEERHRHRYEVNPEYIERLKAAGLVFSGTSPDGRLMEIAELPFMSVKPSAKSGKGSGDSGVSHPFFLGTQFHPEFQAHPLHPHPLFTAFVKAAVSRKSDGTGAVKGSKKKGKKTAVVAQ